MVQTSFEGGVTMNGPHQAVQLVGQTISYNQSTVFKANGKFFAVHERKGENELVPHIEMEVLPFSDALIFFKTYRASLQTAVPRFAELFGDLLDEKPREAKE
jgi:hypothetical protein